MATTTDRSDRRHYHHFAVGGCINQWADDHDHVECWAEFQAHLNDSSDSPS